MGFNNQYIFILGRTPSLSVAEIQSLFKKNNLLFNQNLISDEVLIIENASDLSIDDLNKTLGGTIKIGKVIREFNLSDKVGEISDLFSSDFLRENFLSDRTSKIELGVSIYNGGGKEYFEILCSSHEDILKTIKKNLEKYGVRSHYPRIMSRVLSSASVVKNGLLRKGFEILIVVTGKSLIIGKTIAVQEFEEFSRRDFGRPKRDMKSGVMPPKLARMMINLAKINPSDTLLDPFCGSGTVLQEALYLGYKYVKGFDNSKKAIDDTKANIEWLGKEINLKDTKVEIKVQDVHGLSKSLASNSVTAIVTEPFLGPTFHRSLNLQEVQNISKDLKNLYLASFKEFLKILKENGVVVFILPVFNSGNELKYLEIIGDIKSLGFKEISLSKTFRQSIVVGGKGDFVLREIVKFEKAV